MNKILLPLLALILVACASPKVTVVSEVTVTSSPPTATPIPTPTLHPQFVDLQEKIAASGERFTLLSDGTIQDGAITVPGLFVDKNGVMTLQVGGESVTIPPADVSFDDTKGVSAEGYTLDEATRLWEAAPEIVTTPSGIGFELGAQIEGQPEGVREVVDIVPPADLNYKEKLDWEERNNPETYGFEVGDTRWVYQDGKLVLQDADDPSIEIAEMGVRELVWDWSKMVDENGESVLLRVGKLWEMRGGYPVQFNGVLTSAKQLYKSLGADGFSERISKTGAFFGARVISQDGSQGVQIEFYNPGGNKAAESQGNTRGYVTFWGTDETGKPKAQWFFAENFDEGLMY